MWTLKNYFTALLIVALLPVLLFSERFHHGVVALWDNVTAFIDSNHEQALRDSLVKVKGGEAWLGGFEEDEQGHKMASPQDWDAQHWSRYKVELADYSLSAAPVSNAEFTRYTRATGQRRLNIDKETWEYNRGDDVPATVRFDQAQGYCHWMGSVIGAPVDLPSLAEWQFVAMNRGKRVYFPTDNGLVEPGRNVPDAHQYREAGLKKYSGDSYFPVKRYPPNPLGFYDMAINGNEWTRTPREDSPDQRYQNNREPGYLTVSGNLKYGFGVPGMAYYASDDEKDRATFRCAAHPLSAAQKAKS